MIAYTYTVIVISYSLSYIHNDNINHNVFDHQFPISSHNGNIIITKLL